MKNKKMITEEVVELKRHLVAMEEVERKFPSQSQLHMDVRRNDRNNLTQRLRTLEWVLND